MNHPSNCDCDACFVDDLNAVLRRFVEEREIREHNAAAIKLAADQSAWRDVRPDQSPGDVVRGMGGG